MPRNGSGVFSMVPGTEAVSGNTIDSDDYNTRMEDYESDANTPRPIVAGGTGEDNATDALAALGGQPSDGDLTSIAALGYSVRSSLVKTAANTWSLVPQTTGGDLLLATTFTDPNADRVFGWDDSAGAFIGFTLGTGLAFNDTAIELDADLSVFSALSGTGFATRTGSNAWAQRTLQAPAAGLTITNPAGVAGDPTFALANDLAALEGLSSTGLAARTTADTWAQRSIAGTSNEITVTNGDGVSGNPTISIPSAVTLTGKTITGGTFSGPSLSGTVSGAPTWASGQSMPGLAVSGPGVPVTINSTNNSVPVSFAYNSTTFGYLGLVGTNACALYNGTLKVHVKVDDAAVSIENNGTVSPDFRITAAPTTLATNSAGFRGLPISRAITASATLALADAGCMVDVAMSAGSQTVTIPPNSSVAFPIGTTIVILARNGSSTFTVIEGSGVTLYRGDGVAASGTRTIAQYSLITLTKRDTNEWWISGVFT